MMMGRNGFIIAVPNSSFPGASRNVWSKSTTRSAIRIPSQPFTIRTRGSWLPSDTTSEKWLSITLWLKRTAE